MTGPRIDLVYFEGCPNATKARDNLRAAIGHVGAELRWSEWDLMAESTPQKFRQHGSPTVLVNGTDVTGGGHDAVAMACRADGAPSAETISEALSSHASR
jgi:hypothetical protein